MSLGGGYALFLLHFNPNHDKYRQIQLNINILKCFVLCVNTICMEGLIKYNQIKCAIYIYICLCLQLRLEDNRCTLNNLWSFNFKAHAQYNKFEDERTKKKTTIDNPQALLGI